MKLHRSIRCQRTMIELLAFAALALLATTAQADSHDPNPYTKPDNTWISLSGEVTSVSADSFLLDTATRQLTVEIDEMPYNPLDDEGYQKIRVGDVVRVSGNMDDDLFSERELMADSVVKLSS